MKNFDKRRTIESAPIRKTDLKDLGKIIVDDNPYDENFTINTTINLLHIEENSIEALLAHTEIPDRLNKYHIRYHGVEKRIYIVSGEDTFYLWISGFDEAWVRGKFQQIEEFITSKLDEFNEEQKLAGKIEVPTNKEENNKTVIPETLMKLDGDSKLIKVHAQIPIIKNYINRVFIVHGHDEEMKQAVARVLQKLNLIPIILHEQPDEGKTIIEKFEKYSDVDFAIILLSPDDFAYPNGASQSEGKFRARQNVIMELGYFIAKLGRNRVVTLYRQNDDFEIPSDYLGVLYKPYIADWRYKLADEMKKVDPMIDKNLL